MNSHSLSVSPGDASGVGCGGDVDPVDWIALDANAEGSGDRV